MHALGGGCERYSDVIQVPSLSINLRAYDSMLILCDISIDILARNKCILLTYLLNLLAVDVGKVLSRNYCKSKVKRKTHF